MVASSSLHSFFFHQRLFVVRMQTGEEAIKQGEYTIRLGNRTLIVNIIRMVSTLMLWIGSPYNTSFSNLAVSIQRGSALPSTTVLLSSRPSHCVQLNWNRRRQ